MQWRVSPKVTVHLRQSGQHAEGAKIIFKEILRKKITEKKLREIDLYLISTTYEFTNFFHRPRPQ